MPLTTNLIEDAHPLRIRIKAQGQLFKDSDLLIDQIRAVDNQRLTKGPLLICNKDFMKRVYKAILEVLGTQIEDLV